MLPIQQKPFPRVSFGQSNLDNIQTYQQVFAPAFIRKRTNPADRADINTVYRQIEATRDGEKNKKAYADLSAKEPGHSAFWAVQNNGEAPEPSRASMRREKVYGLNYRDQQYLTFHLANVEGAALTPDVSCNGGTNEIIYRYPGQSPHSPMIQRRDTVQDNQLHQQFQITNPSSEPETLFLTYHSDARDIFQARDPLKPWTELNQQHRLSAPDNPFQDNPFKNVLFETMTAVSPSETEKMTHQALPLTDVFRTNLAIQKGGQYIQVEALDTMTARLRVTVPPQQTIEVMLTATPHDQTLDAEYREPAVPLNPLSFLKENEPYPAGFDPRIWQTAESDLKKLLIPVAVQVDAKTGQLLSKDAPVSPIARTVSCYVPAAGIPLFAVPYGRDSIITSLFTLNHAPALARDTLTVLSYYQGQKNNPFTEEQPGKIMHELRKGILSRSHLLQFSPYYGTVDGTPLYLMLFHQYVDKTKDVTLMRQLWPNYEAALHRMEEDIAVHEKPGDPLKDFLAQRPAASLSGTDQPGVINFDNIGWKDSGRALKVLLDNQGYLENPKKPFALAELQAYVYGARAGAVALYAMKADLTSDPAEKAKLLAQAQQYAAKNAMLKAHFNQAFWMNDKQFVAMAVDAAGQPVRALSSNGAQALWTGLVDEDKAHPMIAQLMRNGMLSGWGVRTLSDQEPAFDPLSYHNGTIWPHDGAIAAAGVMCYGHVNEAREIARQHLQAIQTFPDDHTPELYSGFQRDAGDKEILDYPFRCNPQAWSAASTFVFLDMMRNNPQKS